MNLTVAADLFASRGLHLLPGSHLVPIDLRVQLPDATIVRFTARGTQLRMVRYDARALTSIVIAPECGCGDHHPQTGPARVTLSSTAIPLAERTLDGELLFGWRSHEAGLLRLPAALPHFDTLLGSLTTETRRLAAV